MRGLEEMRYWIILFGVSVGAAVLLLTTATMALAATAAEQRETERAFQLCERATARWERIAEIPHDLLRAISLAESGRWSDEAKKVRAWPWTVTSGGPGTYFPTKSAAMAEVRRLQSKGVENIDVGCMQVNLGYHGHNFRSAAHAMDPDINAAYAARFLTSLRENADSWGQAAGHYHSMTPERTAYYRGKVEKFWAGLRGGDIQTASATPPSASAVETEEETKYFITPIDPARTAALNERFKTIKTAARQLREELDPEARRARQLEAWRTARGRATQLQALLAQRKAELEQRRKQELADAFDSSRDERFAENRRRQLAAWRERIADGASNN